MARGGAAAQCARACTAQYSGGGAAVYFGLVMTTASARMLWLVLFVSDWPRTVPWQSCISCGPTPLQSYGGGRDIVGLGDTTLLRGQEFKQAPIFDDGLIEVCSPLTAVWWRSPMMHAVPMIASTACADLSLVPCNLQVVGFGSGWHAALTMAQARLSYLLTWHTWFGLSHATRHVIECALHGMRWHGHCASSLDTPPGKMPPTARPQQFACLPLPIPCMQVSSKLHATRLAQCREVELQLEAHGRVSRGADMIAG